MLNILRMFREKIGSLVDGDVLDRDCRSIFSIMEMPKVPVYGEAERNASVRKTVQQVAGIGSYLTKDDILKMKKELYED